MITNRMLGGIAILVLPLVLAGCGRDPLGLKVKNAPDEFTVVKARPLILPPDYALRPPAPGTPRPQETAPTDAARAILYQRNIAASNATAGEIALLNSAGAQNAEPNIRTEINRETATIEEKSSTIADAILFWQKDDRGPEAIIDPAAEAERLRKNQEQGLPPTEGEVPILNKDERALLKGII